MVNCQADPRRGLGFLSTSPTSRRKATTNLRLLGVHRSQASSDRNKVLAFFSQTPYAPWLHVQPGLKCVNGLKTGRTVRVKHSGGKEASGAFGAGAVYCHILNKGTWHIPADPLQNTQHSLKCFFWSCPDPELHEKLSWNEKNDGSNWV